MALPAGVDAVGGSGTAPPAPWRLALEGLVWLHRASPDAAEHHQPGLSFDRALPVTVAGFVRYSETPVGPYGEVWGSPTLVVHGRRIFVPIAFMAVDSPASLQGGRANWALPKEMAAFDPDRWEATGREADWSVRAQVLSQGAPMPLWLAGDLLQATARGELWRSRTSVRGVARPARVRVDAAGAAAPAWLWPGRHVGLVVERATMTVRPPRSLEGR